MGHHHRGCGGCGRCGLCYGFGYGYPYGVLPAALAAPALPAAFYPQFGADPAAAMVPAAAAPMMAPGGGQPLSRLPQVMAALQAARANAGGVSLQPAGVGPIGFRPKKVRKHHRRTVVVRPQVFFQPMAIFIPRRVARHFDICSIKVGQYCVFGSRDSVPAEMYANEGLGPAIIRLPPLMPGQHVYITVKNHDHHSHYFRGALNGIDLIPTVS